MWIFDCNGLLEKAPDAEDVLHLDPEHQGPEAVPTGTNQSVHIHFESFVDGRGFSLARQLRQEHGTDLRLIATGHVLPDQARHAFQSGFDAVLICDNALQHFGREAWEAALERAVGSIYLGEVSGGGIWARRHGQSENQQLG